MKTFPPAGTSFSQALNTANETRNSITYINRPIKNLFFALISSALVMLFICSCSRNASSGCGTWPMANSKTYKLYKSETKPVNNIYRNSHQYSAYKKYN